MKLKKGTEQEYAVFRAERTLEPDYRATLKELLESLSESQRNAARCYLSILASAEGGGQNG